MSKEKKVSLQTRLVERYSSIIDNIEGFRPVALKSIAFQIDCELKSEPFLIRFGSGVPDLGLKSISF